MVLMCHNIYLIEIDLGNVGIWCRVYVLRRYHCNFHWFGLLCLCLGYVGGDILDGGYRVIVDSDDIAIS